MVVWIYFIYQYSSCTRLFLFFSDLLTVDHLKCGLSMVMAGSKECIRIRTDHNNVISRNRAIRVCDRLAFTVFNIVGIVKNSTAILRPATNIIGRIAAMSEFRTLQVLTMLL